MNIGIGLVVSYFANMIIFPWFNLHISMSDNLLMSVVYTIISLVRQFILRRYFNRLMVMARIREG